MITEGFEKIFSQIEKILYICLVDSVPYLSKSLHRTATCGPSLLFSSSPVILVLMVVIVLFLGGGGTMIPVVKPDQISNLERERVSKQDVILLAVFANGQNSIKTQTSINFE